VTDADLVAGRLWPEAFLGGRMRLDARRAQQAIERLGAELGLGPREVALGVIRVVNANMERALRKITVERGIDPRSLALVAFGGAGPMHAAELARSLGIRTVVLPRQPGLVCAFGALLAPVGREESATIRLVDPPYRRLLAEARPRIERARRALRREGIPERAIRVELAVEARFLGEAYEIEVPCRPSFRADFRSAHQRLFGHAAEGAPIEVVNLRVRAWAEPARVPAVPAQPRARRPSPIGQSRVADDSGERFVPVYPREGLGRGTRLRGPALLVEMSATTWVPRDFELRVEEQADLLLHRG
jgi:N-methylhydantoinase A